MGEMANALRMLRCGLPTCIQRIDYPMHKGQPNPSHGKFKFVGAIPFECSEPDTHGTPQIPPNRKSKLYDSEQHAIDAALAAGVKRLQGADCRWIESADTTASPA